MSWGVVVSVLILIFTRTHHFCISIQVKNLTPHLGAMVSTLKNGLSKRVIKPRVRRPKATPSQSKPTGGLVTVGNMKKSRSAGFLGSMSNLELAEGQQQSGRKFM